MLLDNAPSRPSEIDLQKEHIKAMYLSPPATLLIQSMDHGVIKRLMKTQEKTNIGSLLEKSVESLYSWGDEASKHQSCY